jgi:phosphatidylglycerophosphatase A
MKLRDRPREAKTPLRNPLLKAVAMATATGAGVGFIPLAPGTFGSMLGVLLFFPLAQEGLAVYIALVAGLSVLGVWSASRAEEIFNTTDDGRIVIDELVGQLITLVPLVALYPGVERNSYVLLVVTGFVTFRVLDIYKPGVIRWVERSISGGAGVMADDCVAGVIGAFGLAIPTAIVLWLGQA